MATIKTEKCTDGTVNIYTPYNRDFVARIKGIGRARWDAAQKCWNIPEAGLETARNIMQDVYGETDLPDAGQMVTIRVKFGDRYTSECRCGVSAFGRTLARAWGRDSGAKVGDDVIMETGSVTSGGSAKNWYTAIAAGTTFRLQVPEGIYQRDKGLWDTEIIEATEADTRTALLAEREKLMARLAEINEILGL